jgi:hypothetical protein
MHKYVILALTFFSSCLMADEHVRPYVRNDGTYVAPHTRSDPNRWRFDNFSARGNVNPYTGQEGTKRHEFTVPPAYNKNFNNPSYNSPRIYDPSTTHRKR